MTPENYTRTYHLLTVDGEPHPVEDLPLTRAVHGEVIQNARWRIARPDGTSLLVQGVQTLSLPLMAAGSAQCSPCAPSTIPTRDDRGHHVTAAREGSLSCASLLRVLHLPHAQPRPFG
ncbi:hypothetical protein ACFSC4_27790 [Deinococcus malanensis]|uniref:hypothetical protein n=1 Tax=Deinococcus malanensis TaxID=1706855 RepID=UPI003631D079